MNSMVYNLGTYYLEMGAWNLLQQKPQNSSCRLSDTEEIHSNLLRVNTKATDIINKAAVTIAIYEIYRWNER